MELTITKSAVISVVGLLISAYFSLAGVIILANETAQIATGYFAGALTFLLWTIVLRDIVMGDG